MQKIAVVIPCYNEQERLKESEILNLIKQVNTTVFLVNDGSTDNTISVIQQIEAKHKLSVRVIDYQENSGKANTIFKAFKSISETNEFDFIGYVDADFSTSSSEIVRMIDLMLSSGCSFIFGSRIKLLNTKIERKWKRHIIGRFIVTIINFRLKLNIYDTQCGAKFFHKTLIPIGFDKPFRTSWLFDVEVFLRLKNANKLDLGIEHPLKAWADVGGSKLGFQSGFKILKEIAQIFSLQDEK